MAGMVNILRAILAEEAEMWGVYNEDEEGLIKAIMLTGVNIDPIIGSIRLVIYSIYGFQQLTIDDWRAGMDALYAYAKHRGCLAIIAYSSLDEMRAKVERIGGRTDYFLIEFPVKR
jgi:hypothetical protein